MHEHTYPSRSAHRAFTIIELMLVVGVIAILAGILLVAFGGVRRVSEQANAERFVNTIGQAVEQFKNDLGWYPPILTYDLAQGQRPLLGNDPDSTQTNPSVIIPERWRPDGSNPATPGQVRTMLEDTRFGSEFTLAVYLLGTGDIDNSELPTETTGGNTDDDDGLAGPGFRDPGPDRSWGGAGRRSDQTTNVPGGGAPLAIKTGRTFGPYLDPAGLSNNLELDRRTGLFKLLDNWGQPVRYYHNWPRKDRPDPPATPQLSIDYTPVELRTADAVDYQLQDATTQPNLDLERPIFNAPFMVVSAGKPVIFGSGGKPIPAFGDRVRDIGAALDVQSINDLPTIQNMSQPFAPGSMSVTVREGLLQDLKSNVRHVP